MKKPAKHFNVRQVFRSSRTWRSLLTKVKKTVTPEKVKGVMYKVECTCGSTYIGEMNRTLTDNRKKGIAVHANNTLHSFNWDKVEVIYREQNWSKRIVKEALHIKETEAQMNLDQCPTLNKV